MDRMESFNLHRKKRAELRLRMDERKTELIIVNAPSAQKGEVLGWRHVWQKRESKSSASGGDDCCVWKAVLSFEKKKSDELTL